MAQDFFAILIDTLVAFRVDGWAHSVRKQLRQSPKFYIFDCGVLNAIRGELKSELKTHSYRFGKLFESFIVQEIVRLNDYTEADYRLSYWRTNTGMEVDVILSRGASQPPTAIEVKSSSAPVEEDVRPLKSFQMEYPKARLLCVSNSPRAYRLGEVMVYPWQEAFDFIFSSG